MRVTQAQAEANRERVVAMASRLLRERGVDGIGIDALMKAAGLTHGGFYRNFASKEALVIEACRHALAENAGASGDPGTSLRSSIEDYLSPRHCGSPGSGCAFAALAVDAGRGSDGIRAVFSTALSEAIERLSRRLPGRAAARRERAIATMAGLVGAIVLARAIGDEALRGEILTTVAAGLLADRHDAAVVDAGG